MPRQAAKTDSNQPEIVQALRDVGATVFVLARVGQGIPDLAVGYRGRNYFLEVKNLDGRGDKLTPAEKEFHDTWRGQAAVVRNEAEALAVIGAAEYRIEYNGEGTA